MPSDHLAASWERTRGHLDRAWVELLPSAEPPAYREFLDHNELELAMETLAKAGSSQDAPAVFWEALADAAEEMHLDGPASEFRQRASDST